MLLHENNAYKINSTYDEDNDSGDDETDELREFDWEEWEKEWSELGWRMRQEVYSKGKEMHNEMSGQWFLKRKMMMVERG